MSLSTITISTVDYLAYASVAEADPYLAVDPVRAAAWAAKSADQKGGLLVAASRRLDLLSYPGERTVGTQERAWPRSGVTLPDGSAVPDDEVPVALEEATILLAGTLASTPAAAQAGTSGSNRKRVKAGSAEVEFFRSTRGVPLSDETAWAVLRNAGILASSSAAAASVGGYASGTDVESAFGDDYGLDEGYS